VRECASTTGLINPGQSPEDADVAHSHAGGASTLASGGGDATASNSTAGTARHARICARSAGDQHPSTKAAAHMRKNFSLTDWTRGWCGCELRPGKLSGASRQCRCHPAPSGAGASRCHQVPVPSGAGATRCHHGAITAGRYTFIKSILLVHLYKVYLTHTFINSILLIQ